MHNALPLVITRGRDEFEVYSGVEDNVCVGVKLSDRPSA